MKIFIPIITYVHDVVAELKKVTFPSRRQVVVGTVLVIGAIIIATLIIGGVDIGLEQLVRIFIIKSGGAQ